MEITAKQFLYPANLLSLLRLALAAPVTCLVARPDLGQDGLLVLLIVAAVLTDVLDGYLSRKLNQTSDLGKILDPVADKAIMAGGVLAAVWWRGFPALVVWLLLYRDALILALGWLVSRKIGRITTANRWGKLNTAVIAFLCVCYLVSPTGWLTAALTYLALATILISGVSYYAIGEPHLLPRGAGRWLFRLLIAILPAAGALLLTRMLPNLRWL